MVIYCQIPREMNNKFYYCLPVVFNGLDLQLKTPEILIFRKLKTLLVMKSKQKIHRTYRFMLQYRLIQ